MRTLLVGEAPPRSRMRDTPTSRPFSGDSGRRFSEMIGADIVQTFDTRNLLSEWPGKAHKGSRLPPKEAVAGAQRLLKTLPSDGARMILCGKRVASAMSLRWLPLLEWKMVSWVWPRTMTAWVAMVPHPSGVNRQWNDHAMYEAVAEFLLAEVERMSNG